MPLPIIFFAASLLLIAIFFALKEREVSTGRMTFVTRFLVNHSPGAERVFIHVTSHTMRLLDGVVGWLGDTLRRIYRIVATTLRYLIVLLAERMIRTVKGEKTLSQNGSSAPSMYLKHLQEHKDNIGNGDVEV
ncbi:MAG: hypothetical protein AAB460_03075 [Patescibacteria group bacterium]